MLLSLPRDAAATGHGELPDPRSESHSVRDLPKLVELGWEQESERLLLQGEAGYPDELVFMAASLLMPGKLEVLSLDKQLLSYGEGPCHLQIEQTMSYDGEGHGSLHFQIGYLDLPDVLKASAGPLESQEAASPPSYAEGSSGSGSAAAEEASIRDDAGDAQLACKPESRQEQRSILGSAVRAHTLSDVYGSMEGKVSGASLWRVVQEKKLPFSRRECFDYVNGRKAAVQNHITLDEVYDSIEGKVSAFALWNCVREQKLPFQK